MPKPKYNTARGEAEFSELLQPPFDFQGVSARVFPLKADVACLRGLCDDYLNFVPRELAQFRPAGPYVYLMLVHYDRMKSRKPSRGWVAQNEIAFVVPLKWYREQRGRMVLVDWVWYTPYIFVDDDISLMTGREVYGWPKLPAQIRQARTGPESSLWGPPLPRRPILTVRTSGFPFLKVHAEAEFEVMLEIYHESSSLSSLLSADLLNPLNPLLSALQTLQGPISMVRDLLDALPSLAQLGYRRPFDVQTFNHITMKQFRDDEESKYVSYQALINSQIEINRYLRGGPLGGNSLLRGDMTGGFHLHIHRPIGDPIIKALGLDVAPAPAGKENLAVLTPLYPFWAEVDLEYRGANTICWCTKELAWYRGSTSDYPLKT